MSRILTSVDPDKIRNAPAVGRGRPEIEIHASAHPALNAEFALRAKPFDASDARRARSIPAEHLALAKLRARMVLAYRGHRQRKPEREAAEITCIEWARRPGVEIVAVDERMAENNLRKLRSHVSLGKVSPATLRRWHSLYKDSDIMPLVPGFRCCGRKELEVPEETLDQIQALAVTSPRGTVEAAIRARGRELGCSITTIRRRLFDRDPAGAFKALGKRGVAEFRREHSPDIERDYSELPYNGLWTLDDVTEDFYGHNFDHTKLIRPYAYAILRGSTREWICAVACETPIIQDQVRSLLGLAMADPRGGIPEEILFERGTIACDEYLEGLLTTLGVKVRRTSMDGGTATPGGFADRASGHAQGKLIEAQWRLHHNLQWTAAGSTGPDERHTAPANLETWKAEAIRRAKDGEQLIAPTPDQWQARIFKALCDHNNREHGGLPSVLDPATMKTRHMTPEEYGLHLLKTRPGTLRKLDEKCLPLFFQKGYELEIGKNGFRLNNFTYGRFDEGLQALVGTKQMVYALAEFPEVAYVEGLGRVVERFDKPAWGDEGDLMAQKRHLEKKVRNQYEEMILRAMIAGGQVTVDSVRFPGKTENLPPITTFATPALLERAGRMQLAGAAHGEAKAEMEKRFEVGAMGEGQRAKGEEPRERFGAEAVRLPDARRGLKERLAEMQEEVGVLT